MYSDLDLGRNLSGNCFQSGIEMIFPLNHGLTTGLNFRFVIVT